MIHGPLVVYDMFVYCIYIYIYIYIYIIKNKFFFVKKISYLLLIHCIIALLLYGYTKYNFQLLTHLLSCFPNLCGLPLKYPILLAAS